MSAAGENLEDGPAAEAEAPGNLQRLGNDRDPLPGSAWGARQEGDQIMAAYTQAAFTLDGMNFQLQVDENNSVHLEVESGDVEGYYLHPSSARLLGQALMYMADEAEGKHEDNSR